MASFLKALRASALTLLLVIGFSGVGSVRTRKFNQLDASPGLRKGGHLQITGIETGGPHSGLSTDSRVNTAPLTTNDANLVRAGNLSDIEAALKNPYEILFGHSSNATVGGYFLGSDITGSGRENLTVVASNMTGRRH